jgi:hypothetical protein
MPDRILPGQADGRIPLAVREGEQPLNMIEADGPGTSQMTQHVVCHA